MKSWAASALTQVLPRFKGCSGIPSTFVILPPSTCTFTPQPIGHIPQAALTTPSGINPVSISLPPDISFCLNLKTLLFQSAQPNALKKSLQIIQRSRLIKISRVSVIPFIAHTRYPSLLQGKLGFHLTKG